MKKVLFLSAVSLICVSLSAKEFKSEEEKTAYAMGVLIAESIKQVDIKLDENILFDGIKDSLKNKASMTNEEARDIVQNAVLVADQEISEKNLREGKDFLEKNKMQKDVKILPSGLQYKIIKNGTGLIPASNDIVTVNYEGKTIKDKTFDSSYERGEPAVFNVSQVIRGWQEALQLMPEGSVWILYIPSELAYGDTRVGDVIQKNSVLVFKVELVKVGEK